MQTIATGQRSLDGSGHAHPLVRWSASGSCTTHVLQRTMVARQNRQRVTALVLVQADAAALSRVSCTTETANIKAHGEQTEQHDVHSTEDDDSHNSTRPVSAGNVHHSITMTLPSSNERLGSCATRRWLMMRRRLRRDSIM